MHLRTSVDIVSAVYLVSDVISALRWDPSSRYLASAGGEDRHVRVWHNTPGLRELVTDLETKIAKATSESFKV